MTHINTLREMLLAEMKALYDIESELVEALPKMVKEATDTELKTALEEHLEETEEQVSRLEEAFDLMGEKPEREKVEAIRGLVKDAEKHMKEAEDGDARDLMIIHSGSHVEHYEMAGYIAAQEWAEMLGDEGVSALLEKNLEEEQSAEEKLSELGTQIAERLNQDADEAEE